MPTLLITHEVEDAQHWAKAWKKGPGSRHEMFAKIGVTARNFRDPNNPNLVGLIAEVPDMAKFDAFMATAEAKQAMEEDRLRGATLRLLFEFTP